MKNHAIYLFTLVLAVVTVSACAKKEDSTPIGRDNSAITQQWAQTNGILVNGVIYSTASNQSLFQDALSGYVEATDSPDVLGFVSATAANQTGFYFGGKVQLQSGLLNPAAMMARTNVRTDAKLLTEIWDEYAGRPDASGKIVEAIRRGFSASSGYVEGNSVYQLKFTDKYGSVEFSGTFVGTNGATFMGQFRYTNTKSWDGVAEPANGLVGDFQVPTCQFFQCK